MRPVYDCAAPAAAHPHLNHQVLLHIPAKNVLYSGPPTIHNSNEKTLEERQLMTHGQEVARRLVLYLSGIGITPVPAASSYKCWCAALQIQYNALGVDQRRLARQTGRRLMREFGSIARAIASFPNLQQTLVASPPPEPPRTRTRQEQFLRKINRWSPLTPPCPSCRMGGGFPKRSWPSREWAEEVLARQHDRDTLRVFECPVQPDFWHLGHVRRRTALPTGPGNTFPPIHFTPPSMAIPSEIGGNV